MPQNEAQHHMLCVEVPFGREKKAMGYDLIFILFQTLSCQPAATNCLGSNQFLGGVTGPVDGVDDVA